MLEWYVNVDWKVKLSVTEAVPNYPGRLSKVVDLWRARFVRKRSRWVQHKINYSHLCYWVFIEGVKMEVKVCFGSLLIQYIVKQPKNRLVFFRRCAIASAVLFYLTDKYVWWVYVVLYRPICVNFLIFSSSYYSVSVLKNSRTLETWTDWLLVFVYCLRSS